MQQPNCVYSILSIAVAIVVIIPHWFRHTAWQRLTTAWQRCHVMMPDKSVNWVEWADSKFWSQANSIVIWSIRAALTLWKSVTVDNCKVFISRPIGHYCMYCAVSQYHHFWLMLARSTVFLASVTFPVSRQVLCAFANWHFGSITRQQAASQLLGSFPDKLASMAPQCIQLASTPQKSVCN